MEKKGIGHILRRHNKLVAQYEQQKEQEENVDG